MNRLDAMARLDAIPRLGWADAPSPILEAPGLAARLGLAWLGVKRDDLLAEQHGGTKIRKLDYLLAAEPFASARRWATGGAIGSGHLVAVAGAAERLGRGLEAHMFWQPPTPHALENLAYVATRADVRWWGTRTRLALGARAAVFGGRIGDAAGIPAGGTTPRGMIGLVRAGLELGAQVAAGELPVPDFVVVPLGSSGTAVGLATGLALAGLRPVILAVTSVERVFSLEFRLPRMGRALAAELARFGVTAPPPAPIRVDRSQIGPGYGIPTPASWEGVAMLAEAGVTGEPVYGGRAMAALARHAPPGARVLFWHTVRSGPLPLDPAWRDRLPDALRRRLETTPVSSRRTFIAGALVAAGLTLVRTSGYDAYPDWDGAVLYAWEAEVLRAVAEAVLPPAPLDARLLDAVPANVDRFVRALPPAGKLEVHALFAAVEQLHLTRLTRLPPADRLAFLADLAALGSLPAIAARGIRDLALLGYYQDPATWPALGYGGPWVSGERTGSPYDALRAPDGALP